MPEALGSIRTNVSSALPKFTVWWDHKPNCNTKNGVLRFNKCIIRADGFQMDDFTDLKKKAVMDKFRFF